MLSGFFFDKSIARCNNNWVFLRKKIKTLLVPFLLYYLIGYAMFYAIRFMMVGVSIGSIEYHGIQDLFIQRQLFNGPIWFVLSLFYVEMLAMVVKQIKDNRIKTLVILALSFWGYMLHKYDIEVKACLDMAFMALLFFYVGMLANILINWLTIRLERRKAFLLVLAAVFYCIFLLFSPIIIWRDNDFSPTYIATVVGGLAIVASLILLFKWISYHTTLRILPWLGKNSIIILGFHHLVYRPVQFFLDKYTHFSSPLLIFAMTMLVVTMLIVIVNKKIPVLAGK